MHQHGGRVEEEQARIENMNIAENRTAGGGDLAEFVPAGYCCADRRSHRATCRKRTARRLGHDKPATATEERRPARVCAACWVLL